MHRTASFVGGPSRSGLEAGEGSMLALSGGSGGRRVHEMGPRGLAAMQQNTTEAMPVEESLRKENG
jgi:hypothetical protein